MGAIARQKKVVWDFSTLFLDGLLWRVCTNPHTVVADELIVGIAEIKVPNPERSSATTTLVGLTDRLTIDIDLHDFFPPSTTHFPTH